MLVDERARVEKDWPAEVGLILSALEAGRHRVLNRRSMSRSRHRTRATLRLHSDAPETAPWVLYTRDVNQRGLGLPLGYGGIVELATPFGGLVAVSCTVYRCRETAHGWFEGSLSFNREQWIFDGAPPTPKLAVT